MPIPKELETFEKLIDESPASLSYTQSRLHCYNDECDCYDQDYDIYEGEPDEKCCDELGATEMRVTVTFKTFFDQKFGCNEMERCLYESGLYKFIECTGSGSDVLVAPGSYCQRDIFFIPNEDWVANHENDEIDESNNQDNKTDVMKRIHKYPELSDDEITFLKTHYK